jgi:hypothetical protein
LKFLPKIEMGSEQGKGRQGKGHEMRKGFPPLGKSVRGNRDELVSAPVEDVPILSLEEEAAIAMADLCENEPMGEGQAGEQGPPESEEAREIRSLFAQ